MYTINGEVFYAPNQTSARGREGIDRYRKGGGRKCQNGQGGVHWFYSLGSCDQRKKEKRGRNTRWNSYGDIWSVRLGKNYDFGRNLRFGSIARRGCNYWRC